MPMRSRLVTCLALAGLGCGTPSIEHGKRIAHGPLQDVILLPLTTRTSEGLLGHVLREDGMTPDRSRTIFRGPPRMSETVQRVTVVRELGSEARVAAEYGPLRAELSESTVTHLAYVVEVTGYAEIDPQGQYVAESDCCFNGEADPSCAPGFVLRLVRGTGVVKYLQRAEGSTELGATEYFQTKLGERYLVVDESSFQDAFFAFEPGDMQRLCSTLPDEASFAALSVQPKPNCSVMAYDARGGNHHLARFLPDEQTCRLVAETFCADHAKVVRCVGSFAEQPTFAIESRGAETLVAGEPTPSEPDAPATVVAPAAAREAMPIEPAPQPQ
jgi:hypothetical protein